MGQQMPLHSVILDSTCNMIDLQRDYQGKAKINTPHNLEIEPLPPARGGHMGLEKGRTRWQPTSSFPAKPQNSNYHNNEEENVHSGY
jgi:hypothetical protein